MWDLLIHVASSTWAIHAARILLAAIGYEVVYQFVSPVVSFLACPDVQVRLSGRTASLWPIRITSLLHSTACSLVGLRVLLFDPDRAAMRTPRDRLTGEVQMITFIQYFTLGYHFWELSLIVKLPRLFSKGTMVQVAVICFSSLATLVSV
jgi:hypothetical protein